MRGGDVRSEALFSYVSCEARVPSDHPLRPIQKIVDEVQGALTAEFEKLDAKDGRPSIPLEKLLRALLLQAFYSVRSERQLEEPLDYNLVFRWFVGPSPDAAAWDVTVFTKNRDGEPACSVVDTRVTLATGMAEREAGLEMVAARPGNHRATLGADKAYDVAGFVADLREHNVRPHVSQNTANRRSEIDGRTTRQFGYALSVRVRKRIEEAFGWSKATAGFRKTHHRGFARVGTMFTRTATANNLIRLPKLLRTVD